MTQKNTVAKYVVENLRGERHEALDAGPDSGVGWNQLRGIFEPGKGLTLPDSEKLKELYVEYYEAEKGFENAVEKYRKKRQKGSTILTSWKECESAMLKACCVMEDAAKKDKVDDIEGFVGKLKKSMRSFCNHAKDGKSFLAFIPSESGYTSILSGGLKVIFEAAEQVGYHRKTVYEHLEQLPSILSNKSRMLEVYADSERLHKLMSILCATIFDHFTYILEWFSKNAGRAALKSIWHPQSYCDKLAENMAHVKLRENAFDDEISILETNEQRKHRKKVDSFIAKEQMIRGNVLNGVYERLQSIAEKFSTEQNWDNDRTLTHIPAKPNPKPVQEASAALEQEQTIQDMLEKFQYDPSLSAKDRHSLLRTSASLSRKDESLALWLTQNVRLRAWLTVDETSLLLVAGNAQHRPSSPTSLVSAKLAAAAAGNVNMVVSSFFCGRHTDASVDADARPSELAMSLLLQLVDQYRGFGTGVVRECVDALEPECVRSVCGAVGRLVRELPSTVIWFCVVDGIGFFADGERRGDMLRVLRCLVRAVRRAGGQRVKLLVTTPGRWVEAEDCFGMDEVLVMPSVCSAAGRLTESKWMDSLGDDIAGAST